MPERETGGPTSLPQRRPVYQELSPILTKKVAVEMQAHQPSTVDKLKMGAMMGGTAGMAMGFLFGSWTIIRYGPGPNGALATLSKYMLNQAAFFGFFFSIGSVIRNDAELSQLQAPQMTRYAAAMAIRSRAEGVQMMKARWEEEKRRLLRQA
ncbi:reactive mitochondrial oxygen species modulator 1-domain-containing protein [Lentinula detonsa]|uniref:Reactive mitochondrial oxygen species modulator 1-domain-containing protein n=1 Tax=Lentinula detonsa TaxID=2804962 RepID=A0A9W8PBX7_9AGAR|nr:reactive mitochondrial oxygen species modulator 1-domain-containing protein [Lentinula detonsa]